MIRLFFATEMRDYFGDNGKPVALKHKSLYVALGTRRHPHPRPCLWADS